jgi:hypothetical protein
VPQEFNKRLAGIKLSEICVALGRLDLDHIATYEPVVPLINRFADALPDAFGARADVPEFKWHAARVIGRLFGLLGLQQALNFLTFVNKHWANAAAPAVEAVAAGLAVGAPDELVRAMKQKRIGSDNPDHAHLGAVNSLMRGRRDLAFEILEMVPAKFSGSRRWIAGKMVGHLAPDDASDLLRLLRSIGDYGEDADFAAALQEGKLGMLAAAADLDPCDTSAVAKVTTESLYRVRRMVDCAAREQAPAKKSTALSAAYEALFTLSTLSGRSYLGEILWVHGIAWDLSSAAISDAPELALAAAISFETPRQRWHGRRGRREFLRGIVRAILEAHPELGDPVNAQRILAGARRDARYGGNDYVARDLVWSFCAELPASATADLLRLLRASNPELSHPVEDALASIRDPEAAHRVLLSKEPTQLSKLREWIWTRGTVAVELVGRDPERALALLLEAMNPSSSSQFDEDLLNTIFTYWPSSKAGVALARLAELQEGDALRQVQVDDCRRNLAVNIVHESLDTALAAVEAIVGPYTSESVRNDIVLARMWSQKPMTTSSVIQLSSEADRILDKHFRVDAFGALLAAPSVGNMPLEPPALTDIIARLALGDPYCFLTLSGAMVRAATRSIALTEDDLDRVLGAVQGLASVATL